MGRQMLEPIPINPVLSLRISEIDGTSPIGDPKRVTLKGSITLVLGGKVGESP